jgi:hypothetical protein
MAKEVRGKALDWTDEKIDKLSVVTDSDTESAEVFWRKHAPAEAKDILDATPTDDAKAI